MHVQQFFLDGLALASYLIGCQESGQAVVVDPERDVETYLKAAKQARLTITHALETHTHADFVSGACELAERAGATVVAGAEAKLGFPHQALDDGETLEIGTISITALHTPGHTPEHLSYVVGPADHEAQLVLTGDTLFVGSVGRPDLLGEEATETLADQLYGSLFDRLLRLDDTV